MLSPDTFLQNRYRIIQLLGRGGMGAVYEATDERLGRAVAVKELSVEGDDLRRAFEREARLLANLTHPSLPRVTDHFAEGEGHYLVMDFVPGNDLKRMLDERGTPFPVDDVVQWAVQLLEALEYLHGHVPPIIHRDIKPSNLKLLRGGRIVLLDFGLAKGGAGQTPAATLSRSIFGYSPHFASLEQMQGEKSTPRSDIYSLSATLYHLLSGRVPPDALARATAVFNEEPDQLVPLRTLNTSVPEEVSRLIMSGLQLKTSARPQSATQMRERLAGFSPRNAAHTSEDTTHVSPRSQARVDGESPSSHDARPNAAVADPEVEPADRQTLVLRKGARRVLTILSVACILAAISLCGYVFLAPSGKPAPVKASTTPSISPQLKTASEAAVTLWATNADGNKLAGGGGVFVTKDEAVLPLSAIEGASGASVASVGMKTPLRIANVNRIDRERRVAVVKVERGSGTPLSIAAKVSPTAGEKVKLVGIGVERVVRISDGTIGNADKGGLEILTADSGVQPGWAVLREKGEFIGVLTDWVSTGRFTLCPASAITALLKQKAVPQTLEVAGAKDLLFDFRNFDNALSRPTLSSQETSTIFTAVYGAKPTTVGDEEIDCGDDREKCLAADRAAWRMQPEVLAVVAGAFTQPGTQQLAYLIASNEEGASHADNFGSKRLAIFDDRKLIVNVDVGDYWDILKTFDINNDGTMELLLAGVYSQMGASIWWSELVEFRGARLRVVKDFDKVYTDDCKATYADVKMFGTQILFTPGAQGSFPSGFRQDIYRSSCGEQPNWKYVPGGSIPSL